MAKAKLIINSRHRLSSQLRKQLRN